VGARHHGLAEHWVAKLDAHPSYQSSSVAKALSLALLVAMIGPVFLLAMAAERVLRAVGLSDVGKTFRVRTLRFSRASTWRLLRAIRSLTSSPLPGLLRKDARET